MKTMKRARKLHRKAKSALSFRAWARSQSPWSLRPVEVKLLQIVGVP